MHGKRACRDLNVQFLDETVVRFKTRARRAADGQMRLARDFSFEFTPDGLQRFAGHVRLLGSRLQMLDLQYEGGNTDNNKNLILSASYVRENNTGSESFKLPLSK